MIDSLKNVLLALQQLCCIIFISSPIDCPPWLSLFCTLVDVQWHCYWKAHHFECKFPENFHIFLFANFNATGFASKLVSVLKVHLMTIIMLDIETTESFHSFWSDSLHSNLPSHLTTLVASADAINFAMYKNICFSFGEQYVRLIVTWRRLSREYVRSLLDSYTYDRE